MRRRAIPILAVAAFALSGCTGGDRAGPTPTATSTTSASPTATSTTSSTTTPPPATSHQPRPTEAPPATDPIDLRPFYAHPCATLTAAQRDQLGFHPLVSESTEGSHGMCIWGQGPGPDNGARYGYRLRLHIHPDLLAQAYKDSNALDYHGNPQAATFEPRQIRGLPAVAQSPNPPDSFRYCEVVVGTGNGQGIALVGDAKDTDPALCDRLVTALEWVIDALRG